MKRFLLSFAIALFPFYALAQDTSVELPRIDTKNCPVERQTINSRQQASEAGLTAYNTIRGKQAQFITNELSKEGTQEPELVDFIDVYPSGGPVFVGLYRDDCLLKILVVNDQSFFLKVYRQSKGIASN